jgi:hypothetical protein
MMDILVQEVEETKRQFLKSGRFWDPERDILNIITKDKIAHVSLDTLQQIKAEDVMSDRLTLLDEAVMLHILRGWTIKRVGDIEQIPPERLQKDLPWAITADMSFEFITAKLGLGSLADVLGAQRVAIQRRINDIALILYNPPHDNIARMAHAISHIMGRWGVITEVNSSALIVDSLDDVLAPHSIVSLQEHVNLLHSVKRGGDHEPWGHCWERKVNRYIFLVTITAVIISTLVVVAIMSRKPNPIVITNDNDDAGPGSGARGGHKNQRPNKNH